MPIFSQTSLKLFLSKNWGKYRISEGYAFYFHEIEIAFSYIPLTYQGPNPLFSKHVIIQMEIGKRRGDGTTRGELLGVAYFDNYYGYNSTSENDKIIRIHDIKRNALCPYDTTYLESLKTRLFSLFGLDFDVDKNTFQLFIEKDKYIPIIGGSKFGSIW